MVFVVGLFTFCLFLAGAAAAFVLKGVELINTRAKNEMK